MPAAIGHTIRGLSTKARLMTVVATFVVLSLLSSAQAQAAQGNPRAARLCVNGGWTSLVTTNGAPFTSLLACVLYSAKGGILKRPQTISFTSASPSPTVLGTTYIPAASATSGLAVKIKIVATSRSVCSKSGAVVTFTAVGICTINANQSGNATYAAAPQVQQSVTVTKQSQTVAFTSEPPSPAKVGSTYTPSATATSGLPAALTVDASSTGVCSMAGAVVTFDAVGTCTVNADQPGNLTYAAAPQVQQSMTVTKQSQTVAFTSAPPSPATVGSTYTPSATATSGLPAALTVDASSTGVCSMAGAVVTFDAAGTCTVNADQAGGTTYDPAPQVQQSVTVTKQSQTVAFTSAPPSPAMVGSTYTPSATATSGLPAALTIDASSSSVCSMSGTVVTFDAAGTCTVNANQAGDSTYDPAPQIQQSVTVTPATAQAICESKGGTFGTATSLWSCDGLPASASADWSSLNNRCVADGGPAAQAVPSASGGWDYRCIGAALYALLLAVGGAIAGVLYAAFHGTPP